MSFAVDVNILLAWPTLLGYVRIATHPAVFGNPLTPEEAMGNVDALLARPHVRTLSEDQGFWNVYRDVANMTSVRGNLVPDAHVAALLKQHGVSRLYSNDTDFRKFAFLRVINPLQG